MSCLVSNDIAEIERVVVVSCLIQHGFWISICVCHMFVVGAGFGLELGC